MTLHADLYDPLVLLHHLGMFACAALSLWPYVQWCAPRADSQRIAQAFTPAFTQAFTTDFIPAPAPTPPSGGTLPLPPAFNLAPTSP